MRSEVYVTHQRPGFHCWPDAPDIVGFLAYPHRHMFYFKLYADVSHNDRQLEFFQLRVKLVDACDYVLRGDNLASYSCEDIGAYILAEIPEASHIEVSEDNENGAIVWRA